MLFNIIYLLLALLGIGFLIFIHELGHYFMARKVGIKVEAFAIGFGKSIVEWERDGVKWKIGFLPFGGYVKMAGMEKQGPIEPSQIEDGFFGKKPWDRIKVAFMGPLVNIVFAFVAFSLIWMTGGREKPFAEFTKYIGWVQKDSALYKDEIRPGDEITKLNDRPFQSFNNFLQSAALDNRDLSMSGYEIDYYTGKKTPFTFTFDHQKGLDGVVKATQVASIMNPAQYLMVDQLQDGSPLANTGIQKGDRIIWMDGQLIFSPKQLINLLNENAAVLTVERNGQTFLTRIPLVKVRDIRMAAQERDELDDWREEAKLNSRVEELMYIPYSISSNGTVEQPFGFIDDESQSKLYFEAPERSESTRALAPGDRILAVRGKPVHTGFEILKEIQTPTSSIIIKREDKHKRLSWKRADEGFVSSFETKQLEEIVKTLGSDRPKTKVGNLILLPPITPLSISEMNISEEQAKVHEGKVKKYQKTVEEIEDKEHKKHAEKQLDFYQNRRALGVYFGDREVLYNPPPHVLFSEVFTEIYRTLYALVSGFLSPKHMSGPVGIMQVMHHGWSLGFNEALFWLGMISLNLGFLNLLPIPVLDGGHILFSFIEMFTKKPLKAKTMERLIIPFVVLLIALFVFLTYNNIVRIFKGLF